MKNLKQAVAELVNLNEAPYPWDFFVEVAKSHGVDPSELREAYATELEAISFNEAKATAKAMVESGQAVEVITDSITGDAVVDIVVKEGGQFIRLRIWPITECACAY